MIAWGSIADDTHMTAPVTKEDENLPYPSLPKRGIRKSPFRKGYLLFLPPLEKGD